MPEEQDQKPSADALQEIDERLKALREKTFGGTEEHITSPHPIGRMLWLAFNIVSDLIAGVICGLGIGYGLDYWLGTRPVFIAIFLILGCIAGVLNVVRYLQRYNGRRQEKRNTPKGKE